MGKEPPKRKQRVRMTNKAQEAKNFSSVKLPRKSEIAEVKANVDSMYSGAAGTTTSVTTGFDPIPNDPMFYVVENSKYWPPPSLQELQASTGIVADNDGFDSYDRREDDNAAKIERTKIVKGVINHPRGKPRKNKHSLLESSSEEDEA